MFSDFKKQNSAFRFFDFLPNYDEFVKSYQLDDTVKFFFVLLRDLHGCNEAQRSRWTFYEVVKEGEGRCR